MRGVEREIFFFFVFRDVERDRVRDVSEEKEKETHFNICVQHEMIHTYKYSFQIHRVLSTVTKEIARPEGAVFMIGLGVGFVACGLSFMKQSEESIRSSPFASKYLAHKLPPLAEGQEKKAHH